MKKTYSTPLAPATSKAISQGTSNGAVGYICGQISVELDGATAIRDDITGQTCRVLGYVGEVLKAMGKTYDDLLMCHVFLRDLEDFDAFCRAYEAFFGSNPPARITVRADIWNELLVEVSAVVDMQN